MGLKSLNERLEKSQSADQVEPTYKYDEFNNTTLRFASIRISSCNSILFFLIIFFCTEIHGLANDKLRGYQIF
jgi:hypothetical protein